MLSSPHITELYILEKVLAEIPDEKIPHKTYEGYIKNMLEILYDLNLRHRETVSDIFRFSVVYFKCRRLTVISKDTDLLKVTIDTTRELGVIGDELKIGEKCSLLLALTSIMQMAYSYRFICIKAT